MFKILLAVFFCAQLLSCAESSPRPMVGVNKPGIQTTPTPPVTGGTDNSNALVFNCPTAPTGTQPNIHQKYCAFDREIWVDFKNKYFRADGQHVDRWQDNNGQPGPEEWHIPDGPVVQGMLLGAYVLEYKWSQSQTSLDKIHFLMGGMDVLEKVTGVPGLIARVAVKKNGRTPPTWLNTDGMVYKDSAIADYIHRADVSGDEYTGLAWGLAVAAKFGPPDVSKWASEYAKRVIRYLEANDWRLVVDGKVTEHGNTSPTDTPLGAVGDFFNSFLQLGNGLHITKILAFFKIANLNGADAAIATSEKNFADKWYGKGVFKVSLGEVLKKSDNVFQVSSAFQAYLFAAGEDATYRGLYNDFMKDNFAQKVAFDDFGFRYAVGNVLNQGQQGELQKSGQEALDTFPYPKLIKNPPDSRFLPSTSEPLPVRERVINSWTWGENPFVKGLEPTAEAAAGKHRFSPLDYITVYNMGRAFGFIKE